MSEKPVRLVIADDHGLVREGLAALLAGHPRCVVVGQAATANEAVSRVQAFNPDVLLLDISLPGSSGVEVLRRLEGVSPRPRVVVVTMHTRLDLVAACFRAGAQGFVVKESAASSLLASIEAVMRGERYLDAAITPQVLLGLDEYAARRSPANDPAYAALTRREQQVLRLLAAGKSPAAIAADLFVSKKTVENHRSNIFGKLGLSNLAELVHYAARLGIVDLDGESEQ